MQIQPVVITDLDGTLLDHDSYDWQAAKPALKILKANNIPVILNTSKNRLEVEYLIKKLSLPRFPYLVENGSALIIPDSFNRWKLDGLGVIDYLPEQLGSMICFGVTRMSLLEWISALPKRYSIHMKGYKDWSLDEISKMTGLSILEAKLSVKKEFSEPFIWSGTEQELHEFNQFAQSHHYNILKGGRFYHLQGNVDKASIIHILKRHYQTIWPNRSGLCQIALGDGENDVGMLNQADFSVCIRSPSHEFPLVNHIDVIYSEKFGPEGWNEEMLKLIKKLNL